MGTVGHSDPTIGPAAKATIYRWLEENKGKMGSIHLNYATLPHTEPLFAAPIRKVAHRSSDSLEWFHHTKLHFITLFYTVLITV